MKRIILVIATALLFIVGTGTCFGFYKHNTNTRTPIKPPKTHKHIKLFKQHTAGMVSYGHGTRSRSKYHTKYTVKTWIAK